MNFVEKVEKLPHLVKKKLLSDEIRLNLEKACLLFGINDEQIGEIAGSVGLIFVGDVVLKDLPVIITKGTNSDVAVAHGIAWEINRRIFNQFPEYFKDSQSLLEQWSKIKADPLISEDEAQKKVLEIEPWILEEKEEVRKQAEENKKRNVVAETYPFVEVFKKYSRVGEQLITENPIRLRSFPAPARPSIKNWIAAYHEELGAGKHDSIMRGNFLFHNENAKRLTAGERQKLGSILKALDENLPVKVDAERQEIVFDLQPITNNFQPTDSRQNPNYPPTRIATMQSGEASKPQTTRNMEHRADNQQPIRSQTINNPQPAWPQAAGIEKRPISNFKTQNTNNIQAPTFNRQQVNNNLQTTNHKPQPPISNQQSSVYNQQPSAQSGGMSFSSPHTLPSERKFSLQDSFDHDSQSRPSGNVVNLKE